MAKSKVSNQELLDILNKLAQEKPKVKAWMIQEELKKSGKTLDESTIRGRLIHMGVPLSGHITNTIIHSNVLRPIVGSKEKETEKAKPIPKEDENIKHPEVKFTKIQIPDFLEPFIPKAKDFEDYVERPIDRRLAIHYNIGPVTGHYKYPLTQGKQGTGKTFAHMHYAYKHNLPFFLFSLYPDFHLRKLFGDKTIKNGTVVFQESIFVKAIQNPSVILFDEIQAVEDTFDFHALLQNRQLFIKEANEEGKVFKLHPQCRIGFAQNPRNEKYIGGRIQQSSFFGRCTFLTFPEFTKADITKAIRLRFPTLNISSVEKFVTFYFATNQMLEQAEIPLDISIRQINNIIELWTNGLSLVEAIHDGLISMLDAISQPKAKEAVFVLAKGVWKNLKEV